MNFKILLKILTFTYPMDKQSLQNVYLDVDMCKSGSKCEFHIRLKIYCHLENLQDFTQITQVLQVCTSSSTYMYAAFTSACITSSSKNRSYG